MDSNFDSSHYPMHPSPKHDPEPDPKQPGASDAVLAETRQYDRFELLSAYLDGEVTPTERRQVETWLANDISAQKLHRRLLQLRRNLQALPTPPLSQPVEQTVTQVLDRLDRKPKLSLVCGGAAIAALFIGALAVPGFRPQIAQQPSELGSSLLQAKQDKGENPGNLMIALDQPVLNMPKSATVDFRSPDGITPAVQDAH